MLEGCDNGCFLPVPGGKVFDFAAQVELETFRELSGSSGAVLFPEVCGELQKVFDLHARVEVVLSREVTDLSEDLFPVAGDLLVQHPGSSFRGADQA